MTFIVGIVGFQGSGKDTVGSFLINNYGYQKDSFAGPLKDAVAAVFGWPRFMLEGDTRESRDWRETPDEWWEQHLDWPNHQGRRLSTRFTPRVAMQFWGTEVLRVGFHNDLWILSLKHRLRSQQRVVVTDCRFPNEIQAIRDLGGRVIRVQRGLEPQWFDLAAQAMQGNHPVYRELTDMGIHASEFSWIGSKFDHVINNDSSLRDLEEKVACVFSPYFPA